MALLQISEMDDFARVSADCFRQNGIVYDVESEISSLNFISNDESSSNDEPSTTNESTADDDTEFEFSDILNYDFWNPLHFCRLYLHAIKLFKIE